MKFVIALVCVIAIGWAHVTDTKMHRAKTDPKCRVPCHEGVSRNFSHSWNHVKYFECNNGTLMVKTCPEHHVYASSVGGGQCSHAMGSANAGFVECWLRRPVDY